MGLLSFLTRSADEAAEAGTKAADDTATSGTDDFVSSNDNAVDFSREATDGVNSGGGYVDFSDDSFQRRVAADFAGRLAEQPARGADAATGNLATGAKWIGGSAATVGSLWVGSELYEDYTNLQAQESREATYEEYLKRREAIRNNPNLTPDQKEEALARLQEAYQMAIQNPDNAEEGKVSRVFDDLFGGMGIADKALVAITLVLLVKAGQEVVG